MKIAAALFLPLAAIATGAFAEVSPTPGPDDPRVQTVFYDTAQVVRLKGFPGYQITLEFGSDERIENVAIGDAASWQVTPNRRANRLFLKPLIAGAATNMTVVTDLRQYAFDLSEGTEAARATELAYVVKFRFPEAKPSQPDGPVGGPRARNGDYSVKGSPLLAPIEVFDDGLFTYFRWADEGVIPAVFAIDSKGQEALPNYGVRRGYIVVEQLASGFVLRNGKDIATVSNNAWRVPQTPGGQP